MLADRDRKTSCRLSVRRVRLGSLCLDGEVADYRTVCYVTLLRRHTTGCTTTILTTRSIRRPLSTQSDITINNLTIFIWPESGLLGFLLDNWIINFFPQEAQQPVEQIE